MVKISQNKYEIVISEKAQKSIKKIDSRYQNRIKKKIMMLSVDPFSEKKLNGRYEGFYSLRVWPYRVIYSVVRKKLLVTVIEIEHRQSVYKK